MTRQEFYERCARLLGAQHDYSEPLPVPKTPRYDGTIRNTYKSRYNGRQPGNGRYPGHGLIRHFGGLIQVNLYNPPLHGFFATEADVFHALSQNIDAEEADGVEPSR